MSKQATIKTYRVNGWIMLSMAFVLGYGVSAIVKDVRSAVKA